MHKGLGRGAALMQGQTMLQGMRIQSNFLSSIPCFGGVLYPRNQRILSFLLEISLKPTVYAFNTNQCKHLYISCFYNQRGNRIKLFLYKLLFMQCYGVHFSSLFLIDY